MVSRDGAKIIGAFLKAFYAEQTPPQHFYTSNYLYIFRLLYSVQLLLRALQKTFFSFFYLRRESNLKSS